MSNGTLEKERSQGQTSGMGQRSGRPVLKICDDDLFFTVDVPVLRIRRSTSAEAARREHRWRGAAPASSGSGGIDGPDSAGTEPPVPWRELAASWRQVLSIFDGLFENDEEEEQARQAYHRGGPCWRVLLPRSMNASATEQA